MDLYSFWVEYFIIHDTRAVHTDTLSLSHSAFVDGDMVAHRVLSMGDFDNGEYNPSDYAPDNGGLNGVVMNDPWAKTSFVFQLVNAGNVPGGALSGRLAATADQLAGIAAGWAGAGAFGFPAGLLLEAFANLWSWLEVDCDGPVAVDQISGPRYWLDARTDTGTQTITFQLHYPGSDSPTGCGGNSNYDVAWSLKHWRAWLPVADAAGDPFASANGVSAAKHNGLLHAVGVAPGGHVSHAMTLSGATWSVDDLGSFVLADLPVCAASFDDRLYVFGVQPDGSISSLAYTVDGGTWTPRTSSPAGLQTVEPITTGVFRNRLYVFARDATTNAIRVSSSADLERWDTWVDVPHTGLAPQSPVAAIALGDTLHLFGIYQTGKRPAAEVVHNATVDGHTWTGWELVEGGARPDDELASEPLDVAAATFRDRVYIATRWVSTTGETTYSLAVNFSGDGDNWSGWRIPKVPETDDPYQPSATAGLAAVNNHLYVLTPRFVGVSSDNTPVWAY